MYGARQLTEALQRLRRWRALLFLLWYAGRWETVGFGVLTLCLGLIPTGIIVASGVLIGAVPGVIDHGLDSADGRRALLAMAVLVGGFAFSATGGSIAGYLRQDLDSRFAQEVHETVARAMLATPGVAALEEPGIADELAALDDAEKRGLFRQAVDSLYWVVFVRLGGVGAFVVMLRFHWWAPFLLASAWQLTNLLYVRTTAKGVTVMMSEGATALRRSEYLRSLAVDAPAAKEMRVFGLSGWVVRQYSQAWLDALSTVWHNRRTNRWLTCLVFLALLASQSVVMVVLASEARSGAIGIGALAVFVQALMAMASLGLVGDPQWWLARSLAIAEQAQSLRKRLGGDTLLQTTAASELSAAASEPSTRSARRPVRVQLERVRFTYRGRPQPVLDGLDLTIPAGQSLAIVGANGAGKTTLIKLLCGLYEPDAGRILLDNDDDLPTARGRVGVIFQDFVRYELSLRANVGFGSLRLAGDDAALESALRDAGAGDILTQLPHGWDSVLARGYEHGADLSGGQWQRVALARALAAIRGGAGLLILDEPTANLDVRAESELFDRFLELTRDVTTILVSHRLSSVRHADRIVVVEGGRIVEDGTHDDLIATNGRYAHMFTLQAERFATSGSVDDPADDLLTAPVGEVAQDA